MRHIVHVVRTRNASGPRGHSRGGCSTITIVILLLCLTILALLRYVIVGTKKSSSSSSSFMDYSQLLLYSSEPKAKTISYSESTTFYELASVQSFGFFDRNTISNAAWRRAQQRAVRAPQYRFPEYPERAFGVPTRWYIKNLQPVLTCPHAERVGSLVDEGSFWICDAFHYYDNDYPDSNNRQSTTPPFTKDEDIMTDYSDTEQDTGMQSSSAPCLIYSIGYSGAFESDLMDRSTLCEVHVMDPHPGLFSSLPSSLINDAPNFHWHSWGLKSSYEPFESPPKMENDDSSSSMYMTLDEMRNQLGHAHRHVDILKLDCKNCEWATFRDWIALNATQVVWQANGLPSPREGNTWHPQGPLHVSHVLNMLQDYGYIMFAKDHRQVGPKVALGYLRLHADFWKDAKATLVNEIPSR